MVWVWLACSGGMEARLVLAAPAPCSGPSEGFLGVDLDVAEMSASSLAGGGVILADLDGDERPELLALGAQPAVGWWDGHGYALDSGALPVGAGATGGAAADVDADGDIDVLVTRDGLPLLLLINVGGVLRDETLASGLSDARHAVAAAFGDADGDGDLDLAVGAWGVEGGAGEGTRLFLNDGEGRFQDRSDLLPSVVADAWVLQVGWVDLDGDGALELLSLHDHPSERPSAALAWDGSRFVDVGVGLLPGFAAMGLGVGDLDGDGVAELFVPGADDAALLAPMPVDGGIAFVDRADALGLTPPNGMAWSGHLADLDDDGALDVFSSLGAWGEAEAGPREALWWGGEAGFEAAEPAAWGFGGTGAGRGGQVADIDGDGRLDVVLAAAEGPWSCYQGGCGGGSFLVVRPRDPGGLNPFAIGARVCATVGARRHCGFVASGGQGMFGSGPPEVHLGLGEAERVDVLELTWPDGGVDRWLDLPARRIATVTR